MNEVWKDIKGFEGLYKISSFGRVKSLIKKEKIINGRLDKKGYIHYALKKDGKSFEKKGHRLVAEAFIVNTYNKPQVNHIDGNKTNNNIYNLEWCTNSENQKHSYLLNPNRGNYFKTNNPRKKS